MNEPAAHDPSSPQARIVAAARTLFFEHGFERVTTDQIARAAKTSKASLYKYFPTMSEVLVAVVRAESDGFETGVTEACDSLVALKAALVRYGLQVMGFLNKPDVIRFTRLMHEEVRGHPMIAARFYEESYQRSHVSITAMLAHGQQLGYVEKRLTAEELAEQLMGMWEGIRLNKTRLGLSKRPYPRPQDWAVKCVDTLLPDG